MSGICGILRFDGRSVAQRDLDRQMRALAHLGPDTARATCDGVVGLGHLSLRITREDLFDAQPVRDVAAAIMLVADVRLDNREDLASALAIDGSTLGGMPDSALILAAYRRWGADCVDHLLGDFAFALWDGRAGKLLLGRDHLGQRHIFYHQGSGFVAFATEIKGLWALPEVPRALCEAGIGRRILAELKRPPGSTLFEGIEAVPGGTVLSVQADGTLSRKRYWEPQAAAIHLGRDEAYYRAAYRSVLAEAVACRLRRATRPVALFLSGGFDSSAIAALSAPALSGRKLIAIASVLAENDDGAESSARRWVDLCRRDMPHLDLRYVTRTGRSIYSGMERAFLRLDGPPSPNAYVAEEMYQAAAAAGARVVIDGYGGDYTLNPRGDGALARLLSTGQFRRFVAEFAAQRRHRPEPLWKTVKRDILVAFLPRAIIRGWRSYRAGLAVFGPIHPVAAGFAAEALGRGTVPLGSVPAPRAMRNLIKDLLCALQDHPTLSGVMPGAHGLELTQPFHDKRVIELALAIPEDLYFKGGQPRYLALTALADLYPAEFQTRLPGNIPLIPDFSEMAGSHDTAILAEIDRMEKSGRLSRYFDFPRMRRMLVQTRGDRRYPGSGYRVRQAMRSFLCARYIEWFFRENV